MSSESKTAGPPCQTCGGASVRAARTRELNGPTEQVYYLAYLWSCTVCGREWVDDGLERLNASGAEGARSLGKRAS